MMSTFLKSSLPHIYIKILILLNLSIIEKILQILSIILDSQCILPEFLLNILNNEKILRVINIFQFIQSYDEFYFSANHKHC
jgi:hypothetical protein